MIGYNINSMQKKSHITSLGIVFIFPDPAVIQSVSQIDSSPCGCMRVHDDANDAQCGWKDQWLGNKCDTACILH